jgi:hypothetical protein
MMFIVSLIEFSKHVQNEISAKVMPKPQNFTADPKLVIDVIRIAANA